MAIKQVGDIALDIVVDTNEADLMLSAAEQTLMGPSLRRYLDTEMATYMRKRISDRFASEGDDVTGPWAALQDATVSIRESKGFPGEHPINKRTGDLENFMTKGRLDYTMQSNGASIFFPGKPPTPELATKVQTAQAGKDFPATVKRPVVGVNAVDMAYFILNFGFWFTASVEGHFKGTGGGAASQPDVSDG